MPTPTQKLIIVDMQDVETAYNMPTSFNMPSLTNVFLTFTDFEGNFHAWNTYDISHIDLINL